MDDRIRVRFAPSPTGPLHIGGVRTALYNYLFAKKNGGDFILRIEDTDQTRWVDGAEEYIIQSLLWCGLEPDESPWKGGPFGPYRQSERKEIYQKHVAKLIENGHAYYAFDTVEELDKMRQEEIQKGNHIPKYDSSVRDRMHNSLNMTKSELSAYLEDDVPYTVRLFVPKNKTIGFEDRIRGSVTFQSEELDDKIILKGDGLPTYHLANVVDDYLMQISHVIRGEEWLSSTAHHVLLYEALGWKKEMPVFTHLPLILKPSGKGKLSKRDGQRFGFPVFPLPWDGTGSQDAFEGFSSFGFNPKAVINFLAFLGWNPGTEQEIFSLEQLVKAFSLDHISKSGARFDYDKAKWFNAQYMHQEDPESMAKKVIPFLEQSGYINEDQKYVAQVCNLFRERVHTYREIPQAAYYFFEEVRHYDRKILKKKWKEDIREKFAELIELISVESDFFAENIKAAVVRFLERHELGFGAVLPLLRIAITGTTKGPDLFQMMQVLGKGKCMIRLKASPATFAEVLSQT